MEEDKKIHLSNLQSIEKLYRAYRKDPGKIDPKWRPFFTGMEFAQAIEEKEEGVGMEGMQIFRLLLAYRRFGHLYAKTNPLHVKDLEIPKELALTSLGFLEGDLSREFPTLGFLPEEKAPLSEILAKIQRVYSSRIGVEYMDLDNPEMEEWIQQRIERDPELALSLEERKEIMEHLNEAEVFESFIHTKYTGQKRFSLEGAESMIPLLWGIIESSQEKTEEFFLGMAHRGRLNVLANVLKKPYAVIFHEFESGFFTATGEGTSDVKYHKGFASEITTSQGKKIHFHLVANPSHLESVDPVVLGEVKARQILKEDTLKEKVVPLLIHGDASFAGQGVVYESMQLMHLAGYETGGTLHLIVNNQIGFTTLPEEGRSTRYCTDIAKTFGCPVLHVNAEDPESCFWAAKFAVELRQKFHKDVLIDLLCYRKYGHNEGDEPVFTQPLHYAEIRAKKTIRELYAEKIASEGIEELKNSEEAFREMLYQELEKTKAYASKAPSPEEIHGEALKVHEQGSDEEIFQPVSTGVNPSLLKDLCFLSKIPEDFHLHPKLVKWLEERKEKFSQDRNAPVFDWALAEHLAFASILWEKIPIRLVGQDSQRGTFSHRHAVWVDQEDARRYFPLSHLKEDQGRFDVVNSPLSEYAALGFEYGYSLADPKTLVLWEAQYGDFANAAQIIMDQYITTAEQKWRRYSSLTLLLPHGMEGQGPEHSSGRIERFLQLAGHNNIQVVNPTTPAQIFHLLRRQALRKLKKPLIIFTPKSVLRLAACASSLQEIAEGSFQEILDDPLSTKQVKRLLFTSGKVFFDLLEQREKKKAFDHVILRVEQLYPFDEERCKKLLAKYKGYQECCWVQEEPENMGGWDFVRPRLQSLIGKEIPLLYAGRERSASPATGSHHRHQQEQADLLEQAFHRGSK